MCLEAMRRNKTNQLYHNKLLDEVKKWLDEHRKEIDKDQVKLKENLFEDLIRTQKVSSFHKERRIENVPIDDWPDFAQDASQRLKERIIELWLDKKFKT